MLVLLSLSDGCGAGLAEFFCSPPSWNFWEHLDTPCLGYEGVVSSLCWSTRCGFFFTLVLNSGLIFSWGVQHGLCLSHNDRRPGYTYCPCLMWMGTFLFGPYNIFLKDPLSWRRQDWCFLTEWIVVTGLALDLVLSAWHFLVLIWVGGELIKN